LEVHIYFADYETDPVISDSWLHPTGVVLTKEEVYGVGYTGYKNGSNYTVDVYVDFAHVFSVTQALGSVLDDIPVPGTTDQEYFRHIYCMAGGGAQRQQHNFYYTEVVPASTWAALKDGYDTNFFDYLDPDPCVPGPGSPLCKIHACDAFEGVALTISDIKGFWRLDEATDVITAADASPNGNDLIDNLGDFDGTPHGVAPSMIPTCVDSTWLFYDDNFGFLEDAFPEYLSENFTWGVVLGALTGTSGQLLFHEIKGLSAEGKIELVKSGDDLDLEINNSVVGTWTSLFTGWTDGDHLMLMFNNTAGSADIYVNFVKFGTSVTFTTIAPTITPGRLWIFRQFAAKAQQMFYYSKLLTATDITRLTDAFLQNTDENYVDPNPQCLPGKSPDTGSLALTGNTPTVLRTQSASPATESLALTGNTPTVVHNTVVAIPSEGLGVWSSGGDLGTGRVGLAGAGTQSEGLSFGGGFLSKTEEYNGTSWSAGGDLSTDRDGLGGAGTQTAGLSFGGYDAPTVLGVTEEYNGTSWSSGGALSTARTDLGGAGTQTAGLSFGGDIGSAVETAVTEEYNGTSWSSGGNLNTTRELLAGCGTQTAGLSFGEFNPTAGTTEEYNGTSWSSSNDLNVARFGLTGAGTQSAGLSFGGNETPGPSRSDATELYNGTSWATSGDLNTARRGLGGCGTQSAGLSFGGNDGGFSVITEEFNLSLITLSLTGYVPTTVNTS
jgi:hypothetical protein